MSARAMQATWLHRQRGAASLVVVMVLFFLVTLAAAYTSRNLLFEQRTSANNFRSTLAFETAEAGAEWALARLNEGRMNDDCTPITGVGGLSSPPQPSFRERYLSIDPTTGLITLPAPFDTRIAGCVFNGTGWTCDCPATGNPNPTVTYSGTGPFAAFWVRFQAVTSPTKPFAVRMQVNACTRVADDCLNFSREAQSGDGLATVWSMVALRSGLSAPPAAALTVRGTIGHNSGNITATNTDSASGGFTVHSGQAVPTGSWLTLATIPGTPHQLSAVSNDPMLALPDLTLTPAQPANQGTNRMFNSVFGMWPTTYAAQPAFVSVDCSGGCDAGSDVVPKIQLNPGRVINLTGGGTLRIDTDVGTATDPVLIVTDGSVEFSSGSHNFFGVIYSRVANWRLQGDGTVHGALIAERDFEARNDSQNLIYDPAVRAAVRYRIGSFAKVPGGWRDVRP